MAELGMLGVIFLQHLVQRGAITGVNSPVPAVMASNSGVSAGWSVESRYRQVRKVKSKKVESDSTFLLFPFYLAIAMHGWKQLIEGWPWFRGEGSSPALAQFRIHAARSTRAKAVRDVGHRARFRRRSVGLADQRIRRDASLRPGMHDIACQVLNRLIPLCRGEDDTASPSTSCTTIPIGRPSWRSVHRLWHTSVSC